ncbi:MAG: hypothetical protein LBD55_05825 [Treponema sp.]|jgi:hypothetical protein|nr:hypothetical protein [Treponema sp.]
MKPVTDWDSLVSSFEKALQSGGGGAEKKEEESEGGGGEGTEGFRDAAPELEKVNKSLEEMKTVLSGLALSVRLLQSGQEALSESLAAPNPKKSLISASGLPGEGLKKSREAIAAASGGVLRHKPFSDETKAQACRLLLDNNVGWKTASIIESQMNKSVQDPNFQIDAQYAQLLLELAKKESK